MTLQEQLTNWQDDIIANKICDEIVDDLNDAVINPEVNPTIKAPAIFLIKKIQNERTAYIAQRIVNIQNAIQEEKEIEEEKEKEALEIEGEVI